MVTLLPYVGQKDLYERVNLRAGWDDDKNRDALNVAIETYLCPGSPDPVAARAACLTHYVAMTGLGGDSASVSLSSRAAGPFGYDRRVSFKDMKMGQSWVILVTETALENGALSHAATSVVDGS